MMHKLIDDIGASLDQHNLAIFPDNQASVSQLPTDFITPLSHLSFLAISGLDSAKFMQGQLTCDVDEINLIQSRPGAHCNPKGRMLTSFHLAQCGEQDYLFSTVQDNLASLKGGLAKYIVFSKAKLTDSDYVALGLSGPKAAAFIAGIFGSAPTGPNQQLIRDEKIVIACAGDVPRFQVWLPSEQALEFWQQAVKSLVAADTSAWLLEDIRAGLANVVAATSGLFIPQMINLEQWEGVSFTKGCYTGQEIVARMKFLGKMKRHLYHFSTSASSLSPASPLYGSDSEQSIGEVVSAVSINANTTEGLAVLADKSVSNGVFSGLERRHSLSLKPLIIED
ncbi:MAG: folate-binding protein [Pseudomonadales bacterium]